MNPLFQILVKPVNRDTWSITWKLYQNPSEKNKSYFLAMEMSFAETIRVNSKIFLCYTFGAIVGCNKACMESITFAIRSCSGPVCLAEK